jgi:pectate lyase
MTRYRRIFMTRTLSIATLTFALAIALSVRESSAAPPAFPGAVGQGAQATGGRGGDVYHVTTLEDYNPKTEPKIEGSFRHAVRSAEGPRTVVFDVAGPIALHAELEIRKNDLTIAGQTSPGGVTFWGYPVEVSEANNVILRHLRFRTGDFHARPDGVAAGQRPAGAAELDPASANGMYVGNDSERVILDHVSAAWGIDEVLSVTKARDVTIQNSIIAEGLNDSLHPKGPHGYGSLVRGELTPDDQAKNVGGYTLYGNLWAHNRARNPSIGGQQSLDRGQSEGDRRRNDLNLVNNVVYDWGDQAAHRSEGGDVRVNLIGNVFICGPAKKAKYFFRENTPGRSEVIAVGNWRDLDQDDAHNGAVPTDKAEIAKGFDGFGDGDRLVINGEPLAFFSQAAEATRPAEAA